MTNFQEIVNILLLTNMYTRMIHWFTKSYAVHTATGQLYTTIDVLIDKFVETGMGKGYMVAPQISLDFGSVSLNDYIKILDELKIYLTEDYLQPSIMKDYDLKNLRDEILTSVNQTLFLLSLE